MKRLLFICLIILSLLAGCMPVEETKSSEPAEAYYSINIIQNGHIDEKYGNEELVTPCCLSYRKYGIIIENKLLEDLSETNFFNTTLNCNDSDHKYMIVNLRFINATPQVFNLLDNTLSVTADNVSCEQIGNSNSNELIPIAANSETSISCCFIIPKEYNELIITYKKYVGLGDLEFRVQENGSFTENDISHIIDSNPISDTDYENEYIIPINSANSDSFYHSNTSNTNYTIENTFDGDFSTCWQDGSAGDGINENLSYYFDPCQIHEIRIVNGNRKQPGSYSNNNRLENILVSLYQDDAIVYESEMFFPDDESLEEVSFLLESPCYCNSATITILSVYSGNSYSDTGISEVSFISYYFTPLGLSIFNSITPLDLLSKEAESPTETYTMDNPRVITFEDFPYIKAGNIVQISGPVTSYSISDGSLTIGNSDSKYGLWVHIMNSTGDKYYTIEAPYVDANGFEDKLLSHSPADVSMAPNCFGFEHCGCRATIVGYIESYTAYFDGEYVTLLRFSKQSKITELEFYN